MAVNTTPPLPKSAPDVSRINTFNGLIVTVTRSMQARGGVGSAILTTQKMTKEQLFALSVQLPIKHGPGFYKFDVVDEGGLGSDEWLVKLGPDDPTQESPFMSTSPTLPLGSVNSAPTGEGVIHLGHGFYYNSDLGTLTTPWRGVYNWKQGDPMPTQPTAASAAPNLSFQSPSTPWGPQPGNWGSFPVADDSRVKDLERTIERQNQQVVEDRRTREMEQIRVEMQRQSQEQNARFEKLIEKLFSKPAGPSDETLALQRRTEQLEREASELRRENAQRERDAALRTEMQATQTRFETMLREMSANKQDPMLPMLMQMIQSSQASAQEAVKAIQAATSTASTSSERNVQQMLAQLSATMMNPMQLMQMVESARSTGAEGSKLLVESMKESLGMQREVFGQLLDVAGQGQQPPWVSIVNEALSKVGAVGEALARRQQAPAPQQQMRPPQQRPPQQQQQRPPQQQVSPPAQAAAPLPAVPTGPGADVLPIKGRKGSKKAAPAQPEEPAAGTRGYTIDQLREASVEDIRATVATLDDDNFFGALFPFVKQIREQVTSGMKAEGAAEMLLRNRGMLANLGSMPPAVELLYADHLEVLIERLLPDAAPAYREVVVTAIESTLEAEESAAGSGEAE
jgi:hypothetical protein